MKYIYDIDNIIRALTIWIVYYYMNVSVRVSALVRVGNLDIDSVKVFKMDRECGCVKD